MIFYIKLSIILYIAMISQQQHNFEINSTIVWNSTVYGSVKGVITSSPYYINGMYVYNITSSYNNDCECNIYYVPHQMYGYTQLL